MAETNHTARKHALLSASGASRWLHCTPSARLEEKFQESAPSVHAEEGTLAHELSDVHLRYLNGEISVQSRKKELTKIAKHKLYEVQMQAEVDKYIEYVVEALNVARATTPDAKLLVEERVDFSHLVERGFGTGDACIVGDGTLEIIDLKYGRGVQVFAENNPQLMLYAAGAIRRYEMVYDIKEVRMTIVQPRLDHISSWTISVEELEKWGAEVVRPKAAEAYQGKGVKQVGEWCRWCKVKASCPAQAEYNLALAKHDFEEPPLLPLSRVIEIYKQLPMLVDWANSVADFLKAEALRGTPIEGYKLVEGRSSRAWTDEAAVEAELLTLPDTRPADYLVTKLAGIPAVEKLVGKKIFPDLLGKYVSKPQGAPTLVPESDGRPPLNSLETAKKDFQ